MVKSALAIFEDFKIRRHYDEKTETWYFSVIDVVYALTESKDPKQYIKKMRARDPMLNANWGTICTLVRMISADGKMHAIQAATPRGILRIVQSIPSPKAEPFKLWLAKVGYERIQETADPSKALDRARQTWQKQGRSKQWIQQRMVGQETRNKLTDYWQGHGVSEQDEFAILTNIIHQEWSGLSVAQHKKLKGLQHENLREHMTEAELLFTALAELSTRQIAEREQAQGVDENKKASHEGGKIAKRARLDFEQSTGTKVVTPKSSLPNFTPKKRLNNK